MEGFEAINYLTKRLEKIHSSQARLYQYHKSNKDILSNHSINELKALSLEYRKQFKTSKNLFT